MIAAMDLSWPTVVRVAGALLCGVGVLICVRLLTLKREKFAPGKVVSLGLVTLPAVAFYKLLALLGLVAVPAATVGVGGYHLFDGIKENHSCMQCHVMQPMGTDMEDPHSNTLAARHFRNKWVPEQQCYHCHTDYGLSGTLESKMTGFRHMSRYTTRTYTEPIAYKGRYSNHNCLHCHDGTPAFEAIASHHTVRAQLEDSSTSCTTCHGPAHPGRERRTPGSADYDRLMKGRNK